MTQAQPLPSPPAPQPAPASEDAPAILIVDDQDANHRLYRAALKGMACVLADARNGEQAIEMCRGRSFAMILLDVHLQGMNGFEVALKLREGGLAEGTPIVFVSAVYTHESNAFRAYRLGAVDYILSPVVPQILRAKAAVFLRLHRMRREAEAQASSLEKAYRELRSAHTELEHFSYSVSHDLRTPLGHIHGFAQLLQHRAAGQLDDKGREYLTHVLDGAEHMNNLINDMLELARMTRTTLHGEPVDLSAMAREIAVELNQAALPPVRWRVDDGVEVHGDARLLRLALGNLLGNAWKYSGRRAAPEVSFGRWDSDGQSIYYVRDNGAGFDVQAAGERLFRPFQRFHADAMFPGTGVGLAIVQRVVVKHGGQIWAESEPGAGASFFFTLPPLPTGAATA